jgi:aspartate aminotransferase-like enzyme
MRDVNAVLCTTCRANTAILVPGGGTFAMESAARQFAAGCKVMVLSDGFFLYRWSQIFEAGAIPSEQIVLKAERCRSGATAVRVGDRDRGGDDPTAPA